MSEQLIPNAVGRLDDVVEALAAGEWDDAIILISKRISSVVEKIETSETILHNARREYRQLNDFSIRYAKDPEFAERVRVACGGGAEVKGK